MKIVDVHYPVVPLPGSEGWAGAYELGDKLDTIFPAQDCDQLAYACEYNDWGPLAGRSDIKKITMLVQGEHDAGDWKWQVDFWDESWIAEGGCDYTGWDCQSWLDWSRN